MSPDLKDLIRYRKRRAIETLSEADINLQNSFLFATANRCYYAAFYAVSALLLAMGKSSSKHSGIMSLFHAHIVRPGWVSREEGRFYDELFKYRLRADYEDLVELQLDDLRSWLNRTEKFVKLINDLVDRELARAE